MEFSRQEYWIGLLFPSPGGLPDPGIKLREYALQADFLSSELPGKSLVAPLYRFLNKHIKIMHLDSEYWTSDQGENYKVR